MIDFSRFETPHGVERSVLILGGTIKGVVLNPYGGSFEAVPRTLNLPFDTVSRVPYIFRIRCLVQKQHVARSVNVQRERCR